MSRRPLTLGPLRAGRGVMSYRVHSAGESWLWLGTTSQVAAVTGGEWDEDDENDHASYHLVLDDPGNGEAWVECRVTPARLRALAHRLGVLADALETMVTVTVRVVTTTGEHRNESVVPRDVRIPAPPPASDPGSAEYRQWAQDYLIGPFLDSGDAGDLGGPRAEIMILASDDPALIGRVFASG